MALEESPLARLKRWGVRPRKRLGQNFLVDRHQTERIAEALEPLRGGRVLEIGAGSGELTDALVRGGAEVWAIEKDRDLAERLKAESAARILTEDALEVRFRNVIPEGPFAVAGNLPYYCTTDLLLHVLDQREGVTRAVFLVQREYADRLVSPPGRKTYGSIGVFVRYFAETEKLFTVPPGAFHPRPDVTSAVVRLTLRPGSRLEPAREKALFTVTRRAFQQRRKQLGTALRDLVSGGREEMLEAFARAGVDPARRGETLSLEEFMELAGALEGRLS